MGLLKRLVLALERIAEKPNPLTPEQMISALQTALSSQLFFEEESRKVRMQESYDWLKTKQEKDFSLTDEEKNSILYGDEQVKLGKLKPYKTN